MQWRDRKKVYRGNRRCSTLLVSSAPGAPCPLGPITGICPSGWPHTAGLASPSLWGSPQVQPAPRAHSLDSSGPNAAPAAALWPSWPTIFNPVDLEESKPVEEDIVYSRKKGVQDPVGGNYRKCKTNTCVIRMWVGNILVFCTRICTRHYMTLYFCSFTYVCFYFTCGARYFIYPFSVGF